MSQEFDFSLAESLYSRLKVRADQQRKEDISKLAEVLSSKSRYWMIDNGKLIYDSKTRLLWDGQPKQGEYPPSDYKDGLLLRQLSTLGQFRIPTKTELMEVAKNNLPLRSGPNYRLQGNCYWQVHGGKIGRAHV